MLDDDRPVPCTVCVCAFGADALRSKDAALVLADVLEDATATCSGFRVFFSALLLAKADPVGAPAEALRLSKVDFTFVAALES